MSFETIRIELGMPLEEPVPWTPAQATRTLLDSWLSGVVSITHLKGTIGDSRLDLDTSESRTWAGIPLQRGEQAASDAILTTYAQVEDTDIRAAARQALEAAADAPVMVLIRGALHHRPTFGNLPEGWYGRWMLGEAALGSLAPLVGISIELTQLGRSLFWSFRCGGYPLLPVALFAGNDGTIEPTPHEDIAAENAEHIMGAIARAPSLLGLRSGQYWWDIVNDRRTPPAEEFCKHWRARFGRGDLGA